MGVKRRVTAAVRAFRNPGLVDDAIAIRSAALDWKASPLRDDRVLSVAQRALTRTKMGAGKMLELRADKSSVSRHFADFEYFSLNLDNNFEDAKGKSTDIVGFEAIPDESFDFVFSADVFEHLEKPWITAAEISRILKPGGVTVHSTLFSWRYHPQPVDFWRFSAEGLKSLFPDLDCLDSDFDFTERRRDLRGQGAHVVAPDAFGGWRENVSVFYAGQKPLATKHPKGI